MDISDLVTPFAASQYVINHLPPLPPAGRVELKLYPGGHMLYLDPASRKAFSSDAAKFYRAAEKEWRSRLSRHIALTDRRLADAETRQFPHAGAGRIDVGGDVDIDQIGLVGGDALADGFGQVGGTIDAHALDAGGRAMAAKSGL